VFRGLGTFFGVEGLLIADMLPFDFPSLFSVFGSDNDSQLDG